MKVEAWKDISRHEPVDWICGWCEKAVASKDGYKYNQDTQATSATILICPNCGRPTYFEYSKRVRQRMLPMSSFGEPVKNLPAAVQGHYEEARRAFSASCFTACVMVARTLLMHIAIEHNAPAGKNFVFYVEHLVSEGVVGKKGKDWLDRVRQIGNQANHELSPVTQQDAETVLTFLGYVLKFNYEFQAPNP